MGDVDDYNHIGFALLNSEFMEEVNSTEGPSRNENNQLTMPK